MLTTTRRRIAAALVAALLIATASTALVVTPARAAGVILCVSVAQVPTSAPCTTEYTYAGIQAAVGASNQGDEIRVAAGVYTGSGDAVLTIRDTVVTITGGYSETDWTQPHTTGTTIIDGQGARRAVYMSNVAVLLENLVIRNGVVGSPGYYQAGGGILAEQNQQGIVILDGVTLEHNRASGPGGGAAVFGDLQVSNSIVRDNQSGEDGGGLWAADAVVDGGQLSANRAARNGGAVFGATIIVDSAFSANVAGIGSGGAAEIVAGQAEIIGSTFSDNRAGDVGGAVHRSFSGGGGGLTIEESLFLRNRAEQAAGDDTERGWSGGGVFIDGAGEAITLMLSDSRFEANYAQNGGGALILGGYDGSIKVTNCRFLNNTAANGSSGALGMSVGGTLQAVEFSGNRAGTYGGALVQYTPDNGTVGSHPIAISGASFSDNSAGGHGGAIFSREGLTLTGARLLRNHAGDSGGGIYIPSAEGSAPQPIRLDDVWLNGNSATADGGAMVAGGTITIRASQIISNTAGAAGGGLRVLGFSLGASQLNMTGVIMADNRGGTGADGILAELSALSLRNVTIASASLAPHAAIALVRSSEPLIATLRNTVVAGHTVGIERSSDTTLAGDYNSFFQNGADQLVAASPAALPWTHQLSGDPLFVNPAAHDMHLQPTSPLIAQGDPSLSYSGQGDADGQVIPAGRRADIGGDQVVTFSGRVFLPLVRNRPIP